MAILSSETLHASCVAIDGRAVLLEGRSGSGKSDLALRLIDRGARLVSDDYTIVRRDQGIARAAAPDTIAGKLEVRGIGIIELAAVRDVPVALVIELSTAVDRLPEPGLTRRVAGVELPSLVLNPFEAAAALKVEWALKRV